MIKRAFLFILAIAWLIAVSAAASAQSLTVVSAGPTGEIANLAQANEIRVIFSEPMVALGRIPQPVKAPFFTVTPALPGTFRWSGTTILIFTPEEHKPLPFATRYEVKIDTTATANQRTAPGRTLHLRFHHAHRQAPLNAVVSQGTQLPGPGDHRAALQSADQAAAGHRPPGPSFPAARMGAPGVAAGGGHQAEGDRSAGVAGVRRQGRGSRGLGCCASGGFRDARGRLGQEAVQAVAGPRRPRNDGAGTHGKLGSPDDRHEDHRARGKGDAESTPAVRRQAGADLLHRRFQVRAAM